MKPAAAGGADEKDLLRERFQTMAASLALIFIFSAVWAQPVEQLKLRPPLGPLPPSFWELHRAQFIGGGIAIFLLVCLGILCLLRPKRAVKLPPAIIARRGLEKLMRQPEDGKVLSEASRILKIFILAEFNLPPEELTTQEFGAALKKIAPLNRPSRNKRPAFCAVAMPPSSRPQRPQIPAGWFPKLWNYWRKSLPNDWLLNRGKATDSCKPMNSHFQFQFPAVLFLLALLPLYSFLRGRMGRLSAVRFSSVDIARAAGGLARSAAGRLLWFLRLLTLALCLIALAGPRFANDRTETEASGVDIMLVLDLSWSMESVDMSSPREENTRFGIASSVLEDFIAKRPNDRIGLIAFSGVPYQVCPLTLNHDWLIQNLRRLHVGTIYQRGELGTAIGDATAAAAKRLQALKNSKSRIIILLTDGDNNQGEIDPVPAAQVAAAVGSKIYTIGIGIEAPSRLPDFDYKTGNLRRDANHQIIFTQMILQPANYEVLDKMAHIGHGNFYRAKNRAELQTIYNQIDGLEKTEVKIRRFTTYTPLFQWPLLAAFALFSLELLLANTRYRRTP